MVLTFCTWDFYRNEYAGQLGEQEFKHYATKAATEIMQRTFDRAESASNMQEKLSLCSCELIDALHSFKQTRELLPTGIQSINNDGLSVSAGSTIAGQSREEMENVEIQAICRRHLTRPINLLYCGVR